MHAEIPCIVLKKIFLQYTRQASVIPLSLLDKAKSCALSVPTVGLYPTHTPFQKLYLTAV